MTPNPVAATSSHHDLIEAGAVMGNVGGWRVPTRFSGVRAETGAARGRVAMAEQGHLTKLRLQGPGVPGALEALGASPPPGRVVGASISTPGGDMDVDIDVARLTETEAWLTSPAGTGATLSGAIEESADLAVFDLTPAFSAAQLVGPESALVVASLTDLDLRPGGMPDGTCAQTTIAEVYGLIIRADIGDLPSYRLFCGREFGIYVWESLVEAGEAYGMALMGSEALAGLEQSV